MFKNFRGDHNWNIQHLDSTSTTRIIITISKFILHKTISVLYKVYNAFYKKNVVLKNEIIIMSTIIIP